MTFAAVSTTAVVGPAATLLSFIGPEAPNPLVRRWAAGILNAAGVKVRTEGLEALAAVPHAVFVCNHQSHFDSLVAFSRLPRHLRFVAKTELFRIPLFGSALRATGNVEVTRSGDERDKQVLARAVGSVRDRVDLLFYPEGTRSEDGQLLPFRKGAAVLALEAQVPIIPLAVAGTREILPKGSRHVHGGRCAALVAGTPIFTAGRGLEDRDALTREAQDAVGQLLKRAQALVDEGERS
jgi:1-acyl-sn-glycerol-3-phosphate acyltransferase